MTTKTKTQGGAFEQLDAARAKAREAHKRAAELEVRAKGAGRRLEGARLALTHHLTGVAAGAKVDPGREAELRDELAAVEARTSTTYDWTQGVQTARAVDVEADAAAEAARLAADDADYHAAQLIAEHREDLTAELTDRAHAARDAVIAAVEQLSAAHGAWRTVRSTWADVLGAAPGDLPTGLPAGALQDIEQVVAQVQGGAKDPRGMVPAPVEPVDGEEHAPSPGALRGWQHIPRVLSSAGGLGA